MTCECSNGWVPVIEVARYVQRQSGWKTGKIRQAIDHRPLTNAVLQEPMEIERVWSAPEGCIAYEAAKPCPRCRGGI